MNFSSHNLSFKRFRDYLQKYYDMYFLAWISSTSSFSPRFCMTMLSSILLMYPLPSWQNDWVTTDRNYSRDSSASNNSGDSISPHQILGKLLWSDPPRSRSPLLVPSSWGTRESRSSQTRPVLQRVKKLKWMNYRKDDSLDIIFYFSKHFLIDLINHVLK